MKSYKIEIDAFNNTIKDVSKAHEKAGSVYLPRTWIGKKVMVVLLEPENTENDNGEI